MRARDAEDLVQDALLRAYRFWDSFQQDSNCKAWLLRIVTNTFINEYQRKKRSRQVLDAASAEQDATDERLGQIEIPRHDERTDDENQQLTRALRWKYLLAPLGVRIPNAPLLAISSVGFMASSGEERDDRHPVQQAATSTVAPSWRRTPARRGPRRAWLPRRGPAPGSPHLGCGDHRASTRSRISRSFASFCAPTSTGE